jgi:curli biogenesis system outer membrane secretion channel CsgG
MRTMGCVVTAAATLLLGGCLATTSTGEGGSLASGAASVDGSSAQGTPQIPKCAAPLGTVALVEEQNPGLAQRGLTSPIPVMRLIIAQSGCFSVVDRGEALTRIQQEQALTGTGGSRRRLVAAQYFMTPNILFQDQNAGGGGGGLGGFLPGYAGLIAGAVGVKSSEAQTLLTLTQTSTGVQIAVAEGAARTRDFTLAGFGFGGGVGGALGAYGSTDIGKTVVAALVDAYGKMVGQLKASGA